MRVALTGTPGTGKTTVARLVETDLDVVHLGEFLDREDLYDGHDRERDSRVVDVEAVRERLADREDLLVESHLAHLLDPDVAVVLRCHPEELHERLGERGVPESTAEENAESEALDVVLAAAVEHCEVVHEVDTTDREPAAVARDVEAAIEGRRDPAVGTVDFLDYVA